MPRELVNHTGNQANDQLSIEVQDEPGIGGACHRYFIGGFFSATNPSDPHSAPSTMLEILFQNGPIGEVGVNGVTNEALLAVIEDRLVHFQDGPFACEENADALHNVRLALAALHRRTKQRIDRGVEGTRQL